jgi:hypothetical protein
MTRGKSAERELAERLYAAEKPASKAQDDGLNKLSRRFRDRVLEPAWVRGDLSDYKPEAVNLRLAGRTWYRPDWIVTERCHEHGLQPRITLVELKGFMRDDAAVKLKVAATTYPMYQWLLIKWDRKAGWDVRIVDRRGIGREPILIPWINGG